MSNAACRSRYALSLRANGRKFRSMKTAVIIGAMLNSELVQTQMAVPQAAMTNGTVEAMIRGGVSLATIPLG